MTEMVIMLNLAISIMGDTFDRVSDGKGTALLFGQAELIDACEATLSQAQLDQIKYTASLTNLVFICPVVRQ